MLFKWTANSLFQFVCLEGLVTSMSDLYPSYFFTGHRRKMLLLAISLLCFAVGLFLVTEVRVALAGGTCSCVTVCVSVLNSVLCVLRAAGGTLRVPALWLLRLQRNPTDPLRHSGDNLHWMGVWWAKVQRPPHELVEGFHFVFWGKLWIK